MHDPRQLIGKTIRSVGLIGRPTRSIFDMEISFTDGTVARVFATEEPALGCAVVPPEGEAAWLDFRDPSIHIPDRLRLPDPTLHR